MHARMYARTLTRTHARTHAHTHTHTHTHRYIFRFSAKVAGWPPTNTRLYPRRYGRRRAVGRLSYNERGTMFMTVKQSRRNASFHKVVNTVWRVNCPGTCSRACECARVRVCLSSIVAVCVWAYFYPPYFENPHVL